MRTLKLDDYSHLVTDPDDWAPAFDALRIEATNPFLADEDVIGQTLDYRGYHKVKRTVVVGADRSVVLAGAVVAASGFDGPVMELEGNYSHHQGFWYVYGLGSTNYKQRQNWVAVLVGNCQSTRCTGFEVLRFVRGAVVSDPAKNSIGFDAGLVHVRDVGSAAGTPDNVAALELAFDQRTDHGSHSSTLQLSALRVVLEDVPWLEHLEPNDTVFIDGQPYSVEGVDDLFGMLNVFPKLRDSATTGGTIVCSHGTGFESIGGNTSGMGAHSVVGLRVGELVKYGSYLGWIGQIIADRGVGVGIRNNQPSGIGLGGGVGMFHCEIDGIAMQALDVSRPEEGITVCSTIAFQPELWQGLSPVRPDHGPQNKTWQLMQGWMVADRGAWVTAGRAAELADGAVPGQPVASLHPSRNRGVVRETAPTIALQAESGLESSWAQSDIQLTIVGKNGELPTKLTLTSTEEYGLIESPEGPVLVREIPLAGRVMVHVYRDEGVWRVSLAPFPLTWSPS